MAALASSSSPFEIDNQVFAWAFECDYYRIIVENTLIIKIWHYPTRHHHFPISVVNASISILSLMAAGMLVISNERLMVSNTS
jgi:hypothetical protein